MLRQRSSSWAAAFDSPEPVLFPNHVASAHGSRGARPGYPGAPPMPVTPVFQHRARWPGYLPPLLRFGSPTIYSLVTISHSSLVE